MTITFLRVRPSETLAEPAAESRRREGTTTVELVDPERRGSGDAAAGGVLVTVSHDRGGRAGGLGGLAQRRA